MTTWMWPPGKAVGETGAAQKNGEKLPSDEEAFDPFGGSMW